MRRWGGAAARLPFASRFAKAALSRFAPSIARRHPKLLGVLDHAGSWAGSYLLRRAVMLPFELDRKLDSETVREGLERLQPEQLIGRAMTPDPGLDNARVGALESSLYMRNQLLRDSDWASMAHSLELRVPFVDWPTLHRVAAVSGRLGKRAGKTALANSPSLPLPPEVLQRGRTGFTVPVARWIGVEAGASSGHGSRQWAGRVSHAFGLS
jgi:asparagine synthase (glutamine-hydrolysing)